MTTDNADNPPEDVTAWLAIRYTCQNFECEEVFDIQESVDPIITCPTCGEELDHKDIPTIPAYIYTVTCPACDDFTEFEEDPAGQIEHCDVCGQPLDITQTM